MGLSTDIDKSRWSLLIQLETKLIESQLVRAKCYLCIMDSYLLIHISDKNDRNVVFSRYRETIWFQLHNYRFYEIL